MARAWYREAGIDHDWFEFVFYDFERICAILGVELRTVPVRLYGGGTRQQPCIYFSGFWNQGDGACFEGRYHHARGAARRIRDHAPADADRSEERRGGKEWVSKCRSRWSRYH